mgnify:CR=1 FL=1
MNVFEFTKAMLPQRPELWREVCLLSLRHALPADTSGHCKTVLDMFEREAAGEYVSIKQWSDAAYATAANAATYAAYTAAYASAAYDTAAYDTAVLAYASYTAHDATYAAADSEQFTAALALLLTCCREISDER